MCNIIFEKTGKLKFNCTSALEKYRVESMYEKEPETISWIDSFKPNSIFYDIGANIGIYSIYAKSMSINTFSFEPYPRNYQKLVENSRLNGDKELNIFQIVLNEKTSIENFFQADLRFGASGGQTMEPVDENGNHFITYEQFKLLNFKLDDFVDIFKIPLPDHVKIDVDGAENKIIKGMTKSLKSKKLKSLLIEFNKINSDHNKTISNLISEFNFTLDNKFNKQKNHSSKRRIAKGSQFENIILTRL